jgi:hypothetical protein
MGWSAYSSDSRSLRAASLGYYDKDVDDIFTQNKVGEIHESMVPSKALLREARDSETHPNSLPIIVALDLTGSMGQLPHELVKDGLPNMVGNMIQRGVHDPAILFLGIGDHECDRAPLQVGQFESGDEELDLWLTRTWIEGHGGGNAGESYLLAWYFAANHTVTDAFEKRRQKGFLFTIGDEPCLRSLPKRVVQEIMGNTVQTNFTDEQLLAAAQEKYNVFHLHMMEGSAGHRSLGYWENLLGQNCIKIDNFEKVGNTIAETVVSYMENSVSYEKTRPVIKDEKKTDNKTDEEEIL